MPTITVTEELINIIKTERKTRKVQSVALSRKLKKNTSFISQLENGAIEHLDLEIFHSIFEELVPDEIERSKFVSSLIEKLSVKLTEDELKKQVWMTNFDLQFRLIPVTEELIEFLKGKKIQLENKGFNTKNIIDKTNLNEDLEDDFANELKENQLYVQYSDKGIGWSIKFRLKDNLIDNIINQIETKSNYINLLGIVNAIYKLEGYSKEKSYDLAKKALYDNKFYTLIEKNYILDQENSGLLSKADKEFFDLKEKLFIRLNFLSDKDVDYINKKLSVLLNNLNKETALTLAIIGVSLEELKEIDMNTKKKFIKEYKEMIQRYKNSTTEEVIERLD